MDINSKSNMSIDEIKKVQSVIYSIFKDFDKFCRENDIHYFLVAGTALGAVRHGGFIPWDDDIDVAMDIKNYKRFLEIAKTNMGSDKYFVQNYMTEKNYNTFFTKVRLNDTVYEEFAVKKMDIHKGFWIDIFPFYNIPDDDEEWKKMSKRLVFIEKLFNFKKCGYSNFSTGSKTVQAFKNVARIILHYVLVLVPSSYLISKRNKIAEKYLHVETKRIGASSYHFIIEKEELYPIKDIDFVDMKAYGPNDIHKYLTRHFGDYMKLPPVEQRITHRPNRVVYPKGDL